MKKQENTIKSSVKLFKLENLLTGMDPKRAIQSLNSISKVIFTFSILFIGAYIYKWIRIDNLTSEHFTLLISNTDILPLYKTSPLNFAIISMYEIARITLISLTFFYFIKFLNSLDMENPFANPISKKFLNNVVLLSVLFFVIDAIGTLNLSYFSNQLGDNITITIFHFEYLFLAYFIYVFAIIFKRGVDIKNEIDLVV